MKARLITSVAAAGVLALVVSCSQDRSAPAVSLPTEASFLKVPPPATCSFTKANQDARAYFSNTKDSAFVFLDLLQTATKGTNATAINNAGFRVLARVGVATDQGLVKVASDSIGSVFANDVLLCTTIGGYGTDFRASLGASGLFAVRAVGDTQVVISRSRVAETGAPTYGAEPSTSAGWQFTGSATNKALFYAAPATSVIQDPTIGTVFDLSTVPSLTFDPAIRVGVCDMTAVDGRIEHVHGAPVILPPSAPSFCTTSSASVTSSTSLFGLAAQHLADWLSPRPAYAAGRSTMLFRSGGGGLVTGLSQIGPVQVLDVVTIDSIRNSRISAKAPNQFNPVITVHVLTQAGTPVVGVTVTLTVANNSGSFTQPTAAVSTGKTGRDGSVSFPNYYLDKAGGYTITATDEFGTAKLSNLFNISGK